MTSFGIRGTFLDFIDDPWRYVGCESGAARFHADGLLVVEDGRIVDFGAHDEETWAMGRQAYRRRVCRIPVGVSDP